MELRTNGSEIINYDYDGFMSFVGKGKLSNYTNYASDTHWHDDIEFLIATTGDIQLNVNGKISSLKRGEGIVINAKQLHSAFSRDKKDAEFVCFLLHPMLLCTSQYIEQAFVSPVLYDSNIPYILLDSSKPWKKEAVEKLLDVFNVRNKKTAPLRIQAVFHEIWASICENEVSHKKTPSHYDACLSILKNMIIYVHKNYEQKISLEQIAYAGNISKSTCLTLFKKYINDTPINYLIGYRLQKSAALLKETDMTISEISAKVGFTSESYFTESFRKKFGSIPSKYRKS